MYSLCLQMFRRNQNYSFQNPDESYQVHPYFSWQVLSFYDGLCIKKMENAVNVAEGEDYCKDCIAKCSFRHMAKHCEKRKLFLIGEKDEWKRAWSDDSSLSEPPSSPFIALITVKILGTECPIFPKAIMQQVDQAMSSDFFKKHNSCVIPKNNVFYQVFYSIGINDVFVLLQIEDPNDIENVICALHKWFFDERRGYIQTYSIIGVNRTFILPDSQSEASTMALNAIPQITFLIRLLALPGMGFSEARLLIEESLREIKVKPDQIKSIMGSYDIEVLVTMSLNNYIHILQPNRLLGWNSPVTLRSNTHIYFAEDRENKYFHPISTLDTAHEISSRVQKFYSDLSTICQKWRQERWEEIKEIKPAVPAPLWDSFTSSYVLACQRIATPQTWGDFADIKRYIENYIRLVETAQKEIAVIDTQLDKEEDKTTIHTLTKEKEKHLINLQVSLAKTTDDFYMLATERLSIEFPSSEKNSTNIYEKGAYEKLIQCWSKWIELCSSLGTKLSSSTSELSFAIVPYTYCQTKSTLNFPANHGVKKAITINLSVREMFKIKELLPTFAHEVGHYTGIIERSMRKTVFLLCFCHSVISKACAILYPDGFYDQYEDTWVTFLFQKLFRICQDYLTETDTLEYLEIYSYSLEKLIPLLFDNTSKVIGKPFLKILHSYFPITNDPAYMANFRNVFVSCAHDHIKHFRSILREIGADLFMLFLTDICISDYLQIISRQAYEYLHFSYQQNRNQGFEYETCMRIFACIHSYYYSSSIDNKSWQEKLMKELILLSNSEENKHLSEFCSMLKRNLSRIMANAKSSTDPFQTESKCLDYLFEYGKTMIESYKSICRDTELITVEIKKRVYASDEVSCLHELFSAIEGTCHE